MDEITQLLSFFISFLFGFSFHILTNFHFKISETYSTVLKYISTFLFVLDIVLCYVLLMYYLNGGIIHIYFLAFVFFGFFFYDILQKNVNLSNILPNKIAKYLHK